MIPVEIGTLDKRVTIRAIEEYEDTDGLTRQRYVDVVRTWARIEPTRANELRQVNKKTMTDLVKITIRHRPGIRNDMVVQYGDQYYGIRYVVDPYMCHTKLELMCEMRTVGDDQDGYQ